MRKRAWVLSGFIFFMLVGCSARNDADAITDGVASSESDDNTQISGSQTFHFDHEEKAFFSNEKPEYKIQVSFSEISDEGVTVTFRNVSESVFGYGERYQILYKDSDGAYNSLYPSAEGAYAFEDILYTLNPGEDKVVKYTFSGYKKEDFRAGDYIFVIEGCNFTGDDEVTDYELYSETHVRNIFDIEMPFYVK